MATEKQPVEYGSITTESFHRGKLVSTKYEYKTNHPTEKETFMRDVIDLCKPFTKGETNRLHLEFMRNDHGQLRIVKRWESGQ